MKFTVRSANRLFHRDDALRAKLAVFLEQGIVRHACPRLSPHLRLPTVITNCSNNYGPYQFPEKLIPVVIQSILARKPVPVTATA